MSSPGGGSLRMGHMQIRLAAAPALLLLLPAAARATDFSDYPWSLDPCASLRGGSLVLQTCEGDCWEQVAAELVAPLPGTFTFDLHYEVEVTGLAQLTIDTIGTGVPYELWMLGPPYTGDVAGIS